jgi:hypothetical protein
MGQVLPILCMILKDKNSAKEVKQSCESFMNEKGKKLLVRYFKTNVWRFSFFEKMDFDALANSLLKHFESKLDCKEYFAMYQKVLASNKKASAAFFRGDMERALTLLANDGDQSQLASALADNSRLSAAIFKIGFNLFSEAPKDAIVMLLDFLPLKFPLNRDAIELKLSSFMNLMIGREFPPLKERKREIPSKERDQDLMEEFKRIDVDNNGFISFEEMNQAATNYGFSRITPEQWRLCCEYLDAKEHIGLEFQRFKKVKQMGDLN